MRSSAAAAAASAAAAAASAAAARIRPKESPWIWSEVKRGRKTVFLLMHQRPELLKKKTILDIQDVPANVQH